MLTRKRITTLIAIAALTGMGTSALALDESTDPYWHKKPTATTPKQASTPAAQRTGVAKDKDKEAAKAAYEKSRAGQAEGELMRSPQHLQDKHNQ